MNTTERIVDMIRSRSEVGLRKYGVSVDRTDLSFEQWCQHAIEEMLDGAQYLMRIKDQVTECYQCNQPALELNENSRCIRCVSKSLQFNREDNDCLRNQLAKLQSQLGKQGDD